MQVIALVAAPFLLDRPDIDKIFPKDAIARAKKFLGAFKGGIGAYTDSRGNPLVREEVAKFIEERDGVKSNPEVCRLHNLTPLAPTCSHHASTTRCRLASAGGSTPRFWVSHAPSACHHAASDPSNFSACFADLTYRPALFLHCSTSS